MKKLLVFVVLLAVGLVAAHHFGLLERLGLRLPGARFIPKDTTLLSYFAPDTSALLLVQNTELQAPLSSEAQARLERELADFQARTGVHPREDVDAIAVSRGLVVVRGRFDWKRLSASLQAPDYTPTTLGGVPAAVTSARGRADLALDGRYLLIGAREALEAALALKQRGEGLGPDSPLVKALDEVGWKHGLLAGALSNAWMAGAAPPALPDIPLLLATLDSTTEDVELRGTLDAGSKEKGARLMPMLEFARAALLLAVSSDTNVTPLMRESLQKTTLEMDDRGRIRGSLRIPHAALDEGVTKYPWYQPPPGFPDPGPRPAASAPVAGPATTFTPDWKPPVLGLLLLALVLGTMGVRARPGLFNVLLHPLYLLPFLVTTLGVFVLRWTGPAGGAFDVLVRPLPEWYRLIPRPEAQTVALSAALPLLFALLSAAAPWLRRFAAGLGVGLSAFLAVQALGTPAPPLIPPAHALTWYVGNALVALVLARLTLPPRRAPEPAKGRAPVMKR